MTDLDEIYNSRILQLAGEIGRNGHLSAPDASATAHSKLCGSTVAVDIKVADGRISDYAHVVKACLLGQAAASVVGRVIVGTSLEEFHQVAETMRRMLKEGGSPPKGRWADLAVLEPVRAYKARHTSTLLVFDAVEAALAKLGAGEAAAASR